MVVLRFGPVHSLVKAPACPNMGCNCTLRRCLAMSISQRLGSQTFAFGQRYDMSVVPSHDDLELHRTYLSWKNHAYNRGPKIHIERRSFDGTC
jgi:hypothetical protein